MEEKLICAILSNIKDVEFIRGNFWIKTKKGYIKICRIQKFIIEKVEIKKGNFFRKPIYKEKIKYLQEWSYELSFLDYNFNIDGSIYEEIKTKRDEYLYNMIIEELDSLCK